jgi:hypothetical protein
MRSFGERGLGLLIVLLLVWRLGFFVVFDGLVFGYCACWLLFVRIALVEYLWGWSYAFNLHCYSVLGDSAGFFARARWVGH